MLDFQNDLKGAFLAVLLAASLVPGVQAAQAGPNAVWQDALLAASDLAQADGFGACLAEDGGRLVIGAPREDGQASFPSDEGAAYVFELVGGAWIERQKLVASDPISGGAFGASAAIDGDVLAVGAPNDQCQNRVYVFRFDGTQWLEEARLDDPGLGICERFGASLAVEGDVLLVGATRADAAGGVSDAGAAYVYRRSAGAWALEQLLTGPNPQADARMGQSVALARGFAYIGVPSRRGGAGAPGGKCLVYSSSGAGWALDQVLEPPVSASNDQFGESIDADGDQVAVGSPRAFAPGSVYVYQRQAGGLVLEAEVQLAEVEAASSFGSDVELEGGTLLVGANTADVQASSSGGAFLFERGSAGWESAFALWTTSAASGFANAEAVELAGNLLLTSSSSKSLVGSTSGAGFSYDRSGFPDVDTSYCPGKVSSAGCSTTLRTVGLPSPGGAEPFFVRGTGFGLPTFGLIFYSLAPDAVPFAGGTLCLQSPVARLGQATPAGVPFGSSPCQARILSGVGQFIIDGTDASLVAGARMYCQMFFRDTADPTGLGLSDALSFVIQP